MTRFLSMFMLMILVMAFTRPKNEMSKTPSVQGDTKIGADATTSGTHVDDQDIQAEEERPYTPDENHPLPEQEEEHLEKNKTN